MNYVPLPSLARVLRGRGRPKGEEFLHHDLSFMVVHTKEKIIFVLWIYILYQYKTIARRIISSMYKYTISPEQPFPWIMFTSMNAD